MAKLLKLLFGQKKKSKNNNKDQDDYEEMLLPSSSSSNSTVRLSETLCLPPTSVYHSNDKNNQKPPKGPKSCPTMYMDHPRTKHYVIDQHRLSYHDIRREEREIRREEKVQMLKRKSQYYLKKWEESEILRKEDKRRQEQLENERNSIQTAVTSMAFCMASVQNLEDLWREKEMYRQELEKYKYKCERLQNRVISMECAVRQASFPYRQSNYQFFNPFVPSFPLQSNYSLTHTSTIITNSEFSSKAGQQQENTRSFFDDDDQDEVKVFREEWPTPSSPLSEISRFTANTPNNQN